jgi:hypothetical protein
VKRASDHIGDGFRRERRDGDIGRPRSRAEHLSYAREKLFVVGSEGSDEEHANLGLSDGSDEGERGLIGELKIVEALQARKSKDQYNQGRKRRESSHHGEHPDPSERPDDVEHQVMEPGSTLGGRERLRQREVGKTEETHEVFEFGNGVVEELDIG